MADENNYTTRVHNFENLWCVSCGCPFQVTVGMMNGRRNGYEITYCPGCGRNYQRHDDPPAQQLARVHADLKKAREEAEHAVRVIRSLRGTITRLKKGRR
jgi:transposase-like protein